MNFKTIEFPIRMDNELTFLSEIDPIALPYWNAYWAVPNDLIRRHGWHVYWALPDDLIRQHNYVWDRWRARTYSGAELIVSEDQKLALLNVHWIIMMPDVFEPAAYALFFEDEIILFHVSDEGVLECKDKNNVSESDQVVGVLILPFILPAHLQSRRQEIEAVIFEIFKYKFTQWGFLRREKTVEFSIRFGRSHKMRDYSYSYEISIPINNK